MKKDSQVLIFGHKNPDTDSVTSAIALSYLRNQRGYKTKPYILGDINKETSFVLDKFGFEKPEFLSDVKIQIKDLNMEHPRKFSPKESIASVFDYIKKAKVRTVPIIDEEDGLIGVITLSDIALSVLNNDTKTISSTYENIVEGLNGKAIHKVSNEIEGTINVVSWPLSQLLTKNKETISKDSIVIVGQRPDVIDYILAEGVKLLIITGAENLYPQSIELARKSGTNVISSGDDTYITTQNMFLCNNISQIMTDTDIEKVSTEDYLESCISTIKSSAHARFPVFDENDEYVGMIGRRHIINPPRKKVILVDHNEYQQSADGIDQADILEVVDHHKIGEISTSDPISYTSRPVGSTNTILYSMYKDYGVEIPKDIAGLMLSGMLSDTLIFRSPTTTEEDKRAAEDLAKIAGVDIEEYGKLMFERGTDISGLSVEKLANMDFKTFNLEGESVAIAQIFTMDMDSVREMEKELIDYISQRAEDQAYKYFFLLITNIIEEGSYVFYNRGAEPDIALIFNLEKAEEGFFVEGSVSRKKQIVPTVIRGIRTKKTLNS